MAAETANRYIQARLTQDVLHFSPAPCQRLHFSPQRLAPVLAAAFRRSQNPAEVGGIVSPLLSQAGQLAAAADSRLGRARVHRLYRLLGCAHWIGVSCTRRRLRQSGRLFYRAPILAASVSNRLRPWSPWVGGAALVTLFVVGNNDNVNTTAVAFALLGVFLASIVVDGLRRDSIDSRGPVEREDSPRLFWFFVALYSVLAVASFGAALLL